MSSPILETVEAWIKQGMPSVPEISTPEFQAAKRKLLLEVFEEKTHEKLANKIRGDDRYSSEAQSNLESGLELAMALAIQIGPTLIAYHLKRLESSR